MKQTLLSLAALIGLAGAAKAQTEGNQNVEILNGWGYSSLASAATINFTDEYGEVYIGTDKGNIDCTKYKGFIVELEEANATVQCKVIPDGITGHDRYPKTTDTKPTTIECIFDELETTKFYCAIQAPSAPLTAKIKSVSLIKKDNSKEQTYMAKNWGCNLTDVSSPSITFESQWAEFGVLQNIDITTYKAYKLVLNKPFDGDNGSVGITGVYSTSNYIGIDLTKGQSSFVLDFKEQITDANQKKLDKCSVQFKNKTGFCTVDVKSITLIHKNNPTPIANIEASDAEVVSTTYYSITGTASAEPAKGMNVVKEQLSDGNIRIRKIMVK